MFDVFVATVVLRDCVVLVGLKFCDVVMFQVVLPCFSQQVSFKPEKQRATPKKGIIWRIGGLQKVPLFGGRKKTLKNYI